MRKNYENKYLQNKCDITTIIISIIIENQNNTVKLKLASFVSYFHTASLVTTSIKLPDVFILKLNNLI